MYRCPLPLEVCLEHCGQRGCNSLQPFDKLLVKSTQSDELSNFMIGSRRRPISNDLDLFGVHVYSISVDDVSTEGYSTLEERGFFDAGKELVLTEWLMYQIEMSLVFIRILREDEDVVDVHPYKDPQVVSKDVIHDALERGWRITEARGHNNPLKGANLCVEGGFLDIFVVDTDLVEPTNKVDLLKYRRTPQCTQDGLDRW